MTHSYRQSLSFRHRFAIFFKGRMGGLLDGLEDPERSLHQVVLDMEQQLEAAKRAASRAVANERRLRDKVARLRRDAEEFDQGARRTLAKGNEADAREYLDRAERARRQASDLERQLEVQAEDTARVRRSVKRLHERLDEARAKHQLLLAKMRQGEARRAMGKALQGAQHAGLSTEFDRLSERVELQAEEDCAYLDLDDELSGDDLRRRRDNEAVDDAVEDRLAALRAEVAGPSPLQAAAVTEAGTPEGGDGAEPNDGVESTETES